MSPFRSWLCAVVMIFTGLGLTPADSLPTRKAAFAEVGDTVVMTVTLPELASVRDAQVAEDLDSGFATTFTYAFTLYEYGRAAPLAKLSVQTQVYFDLWRQSYVVQKRDERGNTSRRYVQSREDAARLATALEQLRLISASRLKRGAQGPYYFVSITAQRNPLDEQIRPSPQGQGSGQELWWARFVNWFAEEAPKAEQVIRARTNPFFLVGP